MATALPTNIRQGWQGMQGPTLAYFVPLPVMNQNPYMIDPKTT